MEGPLQCSDVYFVSEDEDYYIPRVDAARQQCANKEQPDICHSITWIQHQRF